MVILADRKRVWLMTALALLTLCALTMSPARPLQGRTAKLEYRRTVRCTYSLSLTTTVNREPEGACVLP
jgi:hypothetical protein